MDTQRKNVIVISSDEMRADCLGIMGNPDIKTPNIDEFGREAIVFEKHFTCHGKCVPSRVAFITGRYSHTDGFRTIHQHLSQEQPNLLGQLKSLGYQSALFGKNHCWEKAFDGYVDTHSWTGENNQYYWDRRKQLEAKNPEGIGSKMVLEDGFDYVGARDAHYDEIYADQAIDFIRKKRDRQKPFFMQINFEAPHTLYGVDEPYYSMYDRNKINPFPHELPENAPLPLLKMREVRTGFEPNEKAFKEIQASYYGMISKVDMQFGRVMQAIKEEGLLENSIILFWVDHGDFAGQYGLVEKWDTCMADCLMKTPCILYAPSLPKGLRVEGLTSHVDLAPTILDILEAEYMMGIHGKSLLPVIEGKVKGRKAVFGDGGHEDEMFGRFSMEMLGDGNKRQGKQETYYKYPDTMSRTKMVRTEKYKLVIRLKGGNELYHMENDPYEMKNLWGNPQYHDVIMELQQLMIEWCMETDTDQPYQPIVGA